MGERKVLEEKLAVEIVGEGEESRTLEVRVFPDGVEPARVNVMVGGTVNLGNFESLKFSASVSLPCYEEEVPEALERAKNLANDALVKMESAVEHKRKGGKR